MSFWAGVGAGVLAGSVIWGVLFALAMRYHGIVVARALASERTLQRANDPTVARSQGTSPLGDLELFEAEKLTRKRAADMYFGGG